MCRDRSEKVASAAPGSGDVRVGRRGIFPFVTAVKRQTQEFAPVEGRSAETGVSDESSFNNSLTIKKYLRWRLSPSRPLFLPAAAEKKRVLPWRPPRPPPPVVLADVEQRTVPIFSEFVGQTKAFETVEVRARIEGVLERIYYTEGSLGPKGPASRVDRQTRISGECAERQKPPCPRPKPTLHRPGSVRMSRRHKLRSQMQRPF